MSEVLLYEMKYKSLKSLISINIKDFPVDLAIEW